MYGPGAKAPTEAMFITTPALRATIAGRQRPVSSTSTSTLRRISSSSPWTCRPSRAMRRASASPMPLEAPVTSATSCAMESPPRGRWVVPLSTAQRALTASGRLAMTGASMALLTAAEFTEAVSALAAHYGVERLRERLARLNAFTSRRGLNTVAAIAERLHLLTGGLRRQVPATYAFSQVWGEMIGARLGEEGEKRLEALVDQVNACLGERDAIVPGKEADLARALAASREALAVADGTE